MADTEAQTISNLIRGFEALMFQMPYGGTYFKASTPSRSDLSVTDSDRLRVIQTNLAALRDGLREHAQYVESLEREFWDLKADLRAVGRLLAFIQPKEATGEASTDS